MDRINSLVSRARILVVDDEETNLRLLRRILEKEGCTAIQTTSDGSRVTSLVDAFDPDLLLLDLHMPPPDGYAILRALGDRMAGPSGPAVLILTGDGTRDAKRNALTLGASDFLEKPFDSTEALLRIRNILEMRFLHRELAQQNSLLETRVEERTKELLQSQVETLERLARASSVRDDETGRHTQRVGQLAGTIAEALGLTSRLVELIRRAAPLHDVGKIGIPDAILLKPGPLSPEETSVMRTHTMEGARILSGGFSDVVRMAERIALNHHEHWDGSGYPQGLAGDAIPLEARIVSVADCVDALTHNRPYRHSKPIEYVNDELCRCRGTQFDPAVIDALLECNALRRVSVSPPHPWPAADFDIRHFSATAAED